MNLESLNNIFGNTKTKEDLCNLIKRKIEIEAHIASYSSDIEDILANAKVLGLKPNEFNKIVKDYVNSEATLNTMAYLEVINDNLISV
jgi:ribonuclease HIII